MSCNTGTALLEVLQRIATRLDSLDAMLEKFTEKGGKESTPLIPPLKEIPKKKALSSECTRVRAHVYARAKKHRSRKLGEVGIPAWLQGFGNRARKMAPLRP